MNKNEKKTINSEIEKDDDDLELYIKPKKIHSYEYDDIEGYNHIILKFFLIEAIKSINFPTNYVKEWTNNGYQISGHGLFIEVQQRSRKRLKGSNYNIVVYFNVYVENDNGNNEIEKEIKGIFELNDYDKVAECVAHSLFQLSLDSAIQNAIFKIDNMTDFKKINIQQIKSVESINEFVEEDEQRIFDEESKEESTL